MTPDDSDRRWERLMALLTPIHERAMTTARRLCRAVDDGDDLYQETVLHAHAKLSSLRDESAFRSWFYAVLLSVHRSRTRRVFWRRFLSLDQAVERGADPSGSVGAFREGEREQAERASRALATLPAVQREAVVLHDVEGFSMQEIAALERVTVSAVKTRVSRGRAKLARFYRRLGWRPAGGRDRVVTPAASGFAAGARPPAAEPWTSEKPALTRGDTP